MRGPSTSLLWSLSRDFRGGRASARVFPFLLGGWGPVEGVEQQILTLKSFSSGAGKGTSSSKDSSSVEQKQEKKIELGRWWQAFSEKSLPKEDNRLTTKETASRWILPMKNKERNLREQEREETETKGSNLTDQEREEMEPKESNLTEQEREEITRRQVATRWLASHDKSSSQEKPSTQKQLSDLANIPWFGSKKETSTSERERLEFSMQRLALMSKLGDKSQVPDFMFLPPKDKLLRKYFQWDNLSSAERRNINLGKARQEFQMHKTDCGSSQVQIAQLTTKITYMTKHMQMHKKDVHSRKGLEAMVQQRRRILKYLRRKDWDTYCDVISRLGLRDNVMEPQKRRS